MPNSREIVVGIDVGGVGKGFHAVALREGAFAGKTKSQSGAAIRDWCLALGADAIGIDAPCRPSSSGVGRLAEKAMAAQRIFSFSTPSHEVAAEKAFYGWMICGWELFELLAPSHPLFTGSGQFDSRACFETFPHAVACSLAGMIVSAKKKRRVRRDLIRRAGLDDTVLANIDEIDAALCALAAQHFRRGTYRLFGDGVDGVIVVPSNPL